jgi:membrane associated rhomboid family serine protease
MPPVVKNLLIINVLVFFAQYGLSLGASFTPIGVWIHEYLALWPAGVPGEIVEFFRQRGRLAGSFYPWQIVTSAFLHGGMGHIFFNMFGLWIFGMRIENVWGSQRFAFFYFWCVIGASLVQLLVTSAPFLFEIGDPRLVPTVGASGGVLGVLLAFGMMYPDEPIYLYFFVPIKAKYLVIGFAVLSILAGVTGAQAGIAHFAHLGGMLAGFVLIQYWRGKLPFGPSRR